MLRDQPGPLARFQRPSPWVAPLTIGLRSPESTRGNEDLAPRRPDAASAAVRGGTFSKVHLCAAA